MTKEFLKDMVKYLPAQVVPGITGFISIPVVTRLFSPVDYGNYSLVMAAVMVMSVILGWLPTGVIRFYPVYDRDKKLNIFYSSVVKLAFISLFIVTAIFLFNVFQYFLRVQRKVNWYSVFAVWKSIAGLGLGLGMILIFTFKIDALLWGMMISMIIVLPSLCKISIGRLFSMRAKFSLSLFKEMSRYSFPLVVVNLAAWILNLSDRFVLEAFRGSHEVGIYSASYNISDRSIMIIVSLFMLASGPISMHIWEKEGETKSRMFVTRLTRYYLMVCVPLVVGLSVLSKPVMNTLTGEQYFDGHKIIPLVATGIFFIGLQHRYQAGFLYYKRTGFITLAFILSGLMNLGLNFLLIPQYGYFAAAVTTFLSYLFLLILMIAMSRRLFKWEFPFNSLIKVSCVSAIMGTVIYFIGGCSASITPVTLLLNICLGVFIYFVLLFMFREFQSEEKEAIKKVLVKCLPAGPAINK
jgi:O-antigen/teichoic acid export membrane protein